MFVFVYYVWQYIDPHSILGLCRLDTTQCFAHIWYSLCHLPDLKAFAGLSPIHFIVYWSAIEESQA